MTIYNIDLFDNLLFNKFFIYGKIILIIEEANFIKEV